MCWGSSLLSVFLCRASALAASAHRMAVLAFESVLCARGQGPQGAFAIELETQHPFQSHSYPPKTNIAKANKVFHSVNLAEK